MIVFLFHFSEFKNVNMTACNASCGKGFKSFDRVCFLNGTEAEPADCNDYVKKRFEVVCQIMVCPGTNILINLNLSILDLISFYVGRNHLGSG